MFIFQNDSDRLDYCIAPLSGTLAATFDKLQRTQNNLARVVCQSRGRTNARPLLHSLHWFPVRQRVTYKLAVLTHKVRTTATPTYLSDLVQNHATPRALCSSDAPHSSHTHQTGPLHFFCCSSIHLELSTCWHLTVRKHSHFQTPLENPSIQTHSLSPPVLHRAPLYLRTNPLLLLLLVWISQSQCLCFDIWVSISEPQCAWCPTGTMDCQCYGYAPSTSLAASNFFLLHMALYKFLYCIVLQ